MIAFLIISTISLALLLAVYHLALQREKMHGFKRFYLLLAICFSLIIPFIQIETTQEIIAIPQVQEFTEYVTVEPIFVQEYKNASPTINLLPFILWIIYISGALLMLFRFIYNLSKLISIIENNTALRLGNTHLVLLDCHVTPHSFLNYIFFSRQDYNNNKIEQELLQHEMTHITQKHSLDIMLIELLCVIFWFNPIIFLYKKAIKLNHEFLADEAAIRLQNDVSSYQQILLSKIFMNKASGLASHVHYSLTKKRLIMMSKNTSFKRALALKAAMVPVFALVMLMFCAKALSQSQGQSSQPQQSNPLAQNETPKAPKTPPQVIPPWTKIKNQDSLRAVKEKYYNSKPGQVYYLSIKGREAITKRWSQMTPEEKDIMSPPPVPPKRMKVTQEQLDSWADPKQYGLTLDGHFKKNNEVLRKYKPEEFGWYAVYKLYKNSTDYGKYKYHLVLMTNEAFNSWKNYIIQDTEVLNK
jgi:bla regulator protein BlaR1